MKNYFIIVLFAFLWGCKSKADIIPARENVPMKDYLNMHLNGKTAIVDVVMNDSVQLEMFFDTGSRRGPILWEKTYLRHAPDTKFTSAERFTYGSKHDEYPSPKLSVDSIALGYKYVTSLPPLSPGKDGVLAPQYDNDRRVWEVNFEKGYLAIHDSVTVPADACILPLRFSKNRNQINVRMPIFYISGRDTLKTEYDYTIDTGSHFGVAYQEPTDDIVTFAQSGKHVKFQTALNPYSRMFPPQKPFLPKPPPQMDYSPDRIIIPGFRTLINVGVRIDYNMLPVFWNYTEAEKHNEGNLGIGFFKNFNFFIDLKDRRLILMNHSREYSAAPRTRAMGWEIGLFMDKENKPMYLSPTRIDMGGPADRAGIKIGDKIISIENKTWERIEQGYADSLNALEAGILIKVIYSRNKCSYQTEIITERNL